MRGPFYLGENGAPAGETPHPLRENPPQRGSGSRAQITPLFFVPSRRKKAPHTEMPKDNSIKSVLIIGSGPIVIGQACEFDYSGTQASLSLKDEGISVSIINSNPATIMTDKVIADHVY